MRSFRGGAASRLWYGVRSVALLAFTLQIAACAGSTKELAFQEEQKGLAFYRRGEFEKALEYYLHAAGMQRTMGDLRAEIVLLNRIALLYAREGQTVKALEYLDQALKLSKERDGTLEHGVTLSNLGAIYLDTGQPREAIDYLRRAIEIQKKDERDKLGLAESMYHLGRAQAISGDSDEAFALFREAGQRLQRLEVEPSPPQPSKMDTTFNWVVILANAVSNQLLLPLIIPTVLIYSYYRTPEWESIERTYLAGHSTRIDARVLAAQVHTELGTLYTQRGDPAAALAAFGEALKLQEAHLDRLGMATTFFRRGVVEEETGDLPAAKADYLASVERLEEVRGQVVGGLEARAQFLATKAEVYERLIRLLLKLHDEVGAFEIAERARARSFLDLMGDRWARLQTPASEPLIRKHQALVRQLQQTAEELLRAETIRDPKAQAAMRQDKLEELAQLSKEEKALLAELRLKHPQYAALAVVTPPKAQDLQVALPEGTGLLAFYLGQTWGAGFVLTRDRLVARPLPTSPEALAQAVATFRRQVVEMPGSGSLTLTHLQDGTWQADARQLYQALVAPFEADLKDVRTLILVPHRALHYLPFAALLDAQGRPLLERWPLRVLPSASILPYVQAKARAPGRALLAMANPRTELPPLPAAEQEVEQIAKQREGVHIYRREAATKAVLAQEGPTSGVIHLATHGALDRFHPLRSHLRFTPTKGDDGKLTVEEVFDLRLQADLVVLSACETALVKGSTGRPGLSAPWQEEEFPPGDELVGLSRAFLYAGAPTIVASLWKVSDDSTALLMGEFYKNLKTLAKAEALRQAQLTLMRAEIPLSGVRGLQVTPTQAGQTIRASHPYFWAPFILIGAGD